ncbi:MAG: hypothetical protein KDA57_09630 [Planctomycetales bacterium]|nr:hypothetical protein [Planctomycetales bacterium]
MHTVEANWEDEENNRHVAFAVMYARKDDSVEIQAVTPKQVTFLCPESNNPLRSIGVWTESGRDMLLNQLRASGHMSKLEDQVFSSLAV